MTRFLAKRTVDAAARINSRYLTKFMLRQNGIQLSSEELQSVMHAIRMKSPCNLLVFGVGHDSRFWRKLNRGGRTAFVEDNEDWLQKTLAANQSMEAYLIDYGTYRDEWRELLDNPARLAMQLPLEIEKQPWDVILIDAPNGYDDKTPGRMKSIFKASQLAADGAHVFVHDCHREVERAYCDRFLGTENLQGEIHWLRHYRLSRRN